MDKIKLGFALLLLIAGIAGFYYLRESAMVLRVISVLSGIVLAAVVVWFTSPRETVLCICQGII